MKVTVYTKPDCAQCDLTKAVLERNGIRYGTANIYDHLDHITSLGYRSAPVVETPDTSWAGFQPDRIKDLANRIKENQE
jgi:glutaredoxin-like protein NrdH